MYVPENPFQYRFKNRSYKLEQRVMGVLEICLCYIEMNISVQKRTNRTEKRFRSIFQWIVNLLVNIIQQGG